MELGEEYILLNTSKEVIEQKDQYIHFISFKSKILELIEKKFKRKIYTPFFMIRIFKWFKAVFGFKNDPLANCIDLYCLFDKTIRYHAKKRPTLSQVMNCLKRIGDNPVYKFQNTKEYSEYKD